VQGCRLAIKRNQAMVYRYLEYKYVLEEYSEHSDKLQDKLAQTLCQNLSKVRDSLVAIRRTTPPAPPGIAFVLSQWATIAALNPVGFGTRGRRLPWFTSPVIDPSLSPSIAISKELPTRFKQPIQNVRLQLFNEARLMAQ
jgi:hypothetical protein